MQETLTNLFFRYSNVHGRWLGVASRALVLPFAGAFTLTACITLPPTHAPLDNKSKDRSAVFRAISDTNKGCDRSAKAPFGEVTYSGLVRIGDDRWVYLRDTKTCIKSADLSAKYFGILEIKNGELTAAEVEFDLSQVNLEDRPTDLEAFCLLPGIAPSGSRRQFDMIAGESGGYDPENTRRLFRLKFESRAGRWYAAIIGRPANYHKALKKYAGAPSGFEAEGMLCSSQQKKDNFSITLVERGKHAQVNGTWVARHGGGILPLTVDFSVTPPTVAPAAGTTSEYLEIVAPKCSIPTGWSVAEGEWRDLADVHREGKLVWGVSTFEGKINSNSPQSSERDHYCSVIYQLCGQPDCSDLYGSAPSRTVFGLERQDRKIEGLARGSNPKTLSMASDEETRGSIDISVPLTCTSGNCNFPLRTLPRTQDLTTAISKALSHPRPSQVLVVFDVDDTLLTMTQDLGSVAWYKWQDQINKGAKPDRRDGQILRVGAHPGELLETQGILYSLADMEPTQGNTRDIVVDKLKAKGIATYALTARGPQYEDATLRELAAAKIEFPLAPECVGPLCRHRGIIDGTHVVSVTKTMLGQAVATQLGNGRDISINNGVMMVSGQNKGVMLRLLLANFASASSFDAIVFVDDDLPNVIAVADAAGSMNEEVSVYHYTRYEDNVLEFLADKDKRQTNAAAAWQTIHDAVCGYESMRWCFHPTP